MIIDEKYLLGRNQDDHWYVIDLVTGAKVEFILFNSTKILPWRDLISDGDVRRAKEYDKKDILYLSQQEEKITEEQFCEFKEEIIKIIASPEFPFKEAKALLRNSS